MEVWKTNQDVTLASFWHLASHWQQGESEKLEISCEAGSLNIQLNASDVLISLTFIILHLLVKGNPLHKCVGKNAGVMQLKQILIKLFLHKILVQRTLFTAKILRQKILLRT